MPATSIPGNFTDGSVTISDGSATPNTATLSLFTGDSKWNCPLRSREIQVYQAQGVVTGARYGEYAPVDITFSAQRAEWNTDFDRLARGLTTGFASVGDGDVPQVKLTLDLSYDTDTSRIVEFAKAFLVSAEENQGDPSTVTYTFRSVGTVTVDGETYA